jgi:serine/threonine-protein kinase
VRFGRYTLARRIGIGGMGEVFLAREERPEGPRACVVKKVLPHLAEQPPFVRRFRDETRVALRLRHPHIAQVLGMGEEGGELYLALEYVQGKTLSRLGGRLRETGAPLPVGLALLVGERVCEALAYAHAAVDERGRPLELVHRDLSPANVCVSYAGDVKVIDFGAARTTLKEAQTAPRSVIGNLTYMAPEQARRRWVDGRADVYSLAVVLWELLAHRALPQGGTPTERWERAVEPAWGPAGAVREGVPPEVDAALLRALATAPEARYPDAASFGQALAALRARHFPGATASRLGEVLSEAFPRERQGEEEVLARLLQGGVLTDALADARPGSAGEPSAVPPVALAFEHPLAEAPTEVAGGGDLSFAPAGAGRAAEAGGEEEEDTEGDVLARLQPARTRVGFGMVLTDGRGAEAHLLREIEGPGSGPRTAVTGPLPGAVEGTERPVPLWLGVVVFATAALVGLAGVLWLGR